MGVLEFHVPSYNFSILILNIIAEDLFAHISSLGSISEFNYILFLITINFTIYNIYISLVLSVCLERFLKPLGQLG